MPDQQVREPAPVRPWDEPREIAFDLKTAATATTLTITGEKKFAGDVKEEQFHRVERRYREVEPPIEAAKRPGVSLAAAAGR